MIAKYYIFVLLMIPIQLLGQVGTPISLSKSISVLSNVNYNGSVDVNNPTNETLYLRIFDDNAILLSQEAIYPGSSGATPFSFTASNTAQYQLWIGFDQGFNNASFSIDNYYLSYSETAVEQICTNDDSYRYGFSGMEKDDEVKGGGNSYTTFFRQYDPRLGRWLTIDPKIYTHQWESPYTAMANMPIIANDILGDDIKIGKKKVDESKNPGEFKGQKTRLANGENGLYGAVDTKEYSDWKSKKEAYDAHVKEVADFNKAQDQKGIELAKQLNDNLTGIQVTYDQQSSSIIISEGKVKSKLDKQVKKTIKSKETMFLNTGNNFVELKNNNVSISLEDLSNLNNLGSGYSKVAEAELLGAFTMFNTGSQEKAENAELNLILIALQRSPSYMFPFFPEKVKPQHGNGVLIFVGTGEFKGQVILTIDSKTGNVTTPYTKDQQNR